jgi:hypothetical protein
MPLGIVISDPKITRACSGSQDDDEHAAAQSDVPRQESRGFVGGGAVFIRFDSSDS